MPVNNPLERILREIRRRTRVVGAFPDGQSALNLAAARLRHIAGTACSKRILMNTSSGYLRIPARINIAAARYVLRKFPNLESYAIR
jgi:transposase-like protein